jgi:hypothetical protein
MNTHRKIVPDHALKLMEHIPDSVNIGDLH